MHVPLHDQNQGPFFVEQGILPTLWVQIFHRNNINHGNNITIINSIIFTGKYHLHNLKHIDFSQWNGSSYIIEWSFSVLRNIRECQTNLCLAQSCVTPSINYVIHTIWYIHHAMLYIHYITYYLYFHNPQ